MVHTASSADGSMRPSKPEQQLPPLLGDVGDAPAPWRRPAAAPRPAAPPPAAARRRSDPAARRSARPGRTAVRRAAMRRYRSIRCSAAGTYALRDVRRHRQVGGALHPHGHLPALLLQHRVVQQLQVHVVAHATSCSRDCSAPSRLPAPRISRSRMAILKPEPNSTYSRMAVSRLAATSVSTFPARYVR